MRRALVLAIAIVSVPASALAEDDKARAVALFDEGIKEMKAGNFEKACASLKQSNEIHADSGTRGSLARCYEKLGKIASAWKLWVDLSTTAPKNLRPDAAANAAKLEPRVPKYVLKYSLGSSPRLSITINGAVVDPTPDVTVAIDPGKYVLEANAAGYTGWKHEFTTVEGKTEEIAIPTLAPIKVAQPQPQPEPIAEGPPKSTRRTIGFWTMGAGGAVLLGGVVMGVIAKGRYDDAKDLCGGDIDACDPTRLDESQAKVDSARTAGNFATVGVIVGGAAIVTGLVLFVTAPKAKQSVAISPVIGTDSAGVVVRGGF